jgi:surfactin synthase thioesterase subunit
MEGSGARGVARRIKRQIKGLAASAVSPARRQQPGAAVENFMDTSVLPPEQAQFARALFDALEKYHPQSYDGPVLLYAARTEPLLHLHQVDATWKKIAKEIEIVHVDGDHLSMVREPRVAALAGDLRERLSRFSAATQRPPAMPQQNLALAEFEAASPMLAQIAQTSS